VGPLVHHGAGSAALHPVPDLTAGQHHGLAVGYRRPLRPARHGVGRTTRPRNHQRPTRTRHFLRLRRHPTPAPHATPWATLGNQRPHSRIGGSRLRPAIHLQLSNSGTDDFVWLRASRRSMVQLPAQLLRPLHR
jgi:hypothetical protein